jgi:preprotein translocase subunit Sec63
MATFETYPVINPYARLGLRPGAPLAEVKRAYRRLAMEHHPDRGGSADLNTFLAVKAAYESIVADRPTFAYRSVVEPGDRRPAAVYRASAAAHVPRGVPTGARPASAPAARSGWPGGRWYWEGRHGRGARR